MAFLGKTYSFVKHEKFDEWLKSVGVSDDKIAALIADKPTQKIVQSGDSYVITQSSSSGTQESTFKSGVQFNDTIGSEKTPITSTYTVDGNTVTQVFSGPYGTNTFKRVFNGDDLVVTITGDKFTGEAKRYYKA